MSASTESLDVPKGEFLHPESMITPGIAGALIMVIANACSTQFGISAPFCAICLSFLICLLIVSASQGGWKELPLWKKAIYYVFNSLIVFSVATGSATTASSATATNREKLPPAERLTPYFHGAAPSAGAEPTSSRGFFKPWF